MNAYWLPPGCHVQLETEAVEVNRGGRRFTLHMPKPTPADLREIAAHLRSAQRRILARRSTESIIRSLDRAAALWLSPSYRPRLLARHTISIITGFSSEMVARAIELEQAASRAPDMVAALERELGDSKALDGFVRTAKGRSMAIGPQLIGGIFSANIPALPHLTVMRAFLVKAACFGRVSSDEPIYLPLYAESLREVDPELAECLAVVHWDRADRVCEAAFLGSLDHLIAYGGDEALGGLRERLPEGVAATWHGHRMGFAYVGRPALMGGIDGLVDRLAFDFSIFDQHACLAPQACFVERGGRTSPLVFARHLSDAMEAWLDELPPRSLEVDEMAPLRAALDAAALRELMGEGGACVVSPPTRLQGAVVMERPERFEPVPLDRFVRVIPVDDVDDMLTLLEPVKRYLQCAAVAGCDDATRARLARLGLSRLCPPGRMGTPTMVWHHDGEGCLASLVSWCDEETRMPA
ncbi:MAG: acyl-CoA reductase [Myxococcota bacterium]